MTTLIDIGSTIVKFAELDSENRIARREFYPRDYSVRVYDQVTGLLEGYCAGRSHQQFRICSSANGGLRVGIVCLTERYSGNVAANMALAAGGNVVFTEIAGSLPDEPPAAVDALVVTGGIDCPEAELLLERLRLFDADRYRFQALIYAGNSFMADEFRSLHANAIVIENPLSERLEAGSEQLLQRIRDMYLDDLIEKEGVARLQALSEVPIWPTPAIVNMAFESIGRPGSRLSFPQPSVTIDIGGATTDIHFGLEVLDPGGTVRSEGYRETNRHVFTDLGVLASKESTLTRLSENGRLFELFSTLYGQGASRLYAEFREGRFANDLLFYACLFLALDSVTGRADAGSPLLGLQKVNSMVITGGASQVVDPALTSEITRLFLPNGRTAGINVVLDADYEMWIEGMKLLAPLPETADATAP